MNANNEIPRDLEQLHRLLQQKVGRNLLHYQQIEQLMKALVIGARQSFTRQGMAEETQARSATILKEPMGSVRNLLFEKAITTSGTGHDKEVFESGIPAELITRFTIDFGSNFSGFDACRAEFDNMIRQRNELVHHFLSKHKLSSVAAVSRAIEELDRQHEATKPLRDRLLTWVKGGRDAMKTMAEFLTSEEGWHLVEMLRLRESRLCQLLIEAASRSARQDGWTSLSSAGQLLRKEAPDDYDQIRSHYGHKTLKALLIATELFEVMDETTLRGGARTLFRLKTGARSGAH